MQNQPVPTGNNRDAKVYEMQWDCKFCGTKKLLGKTHRFCPNCGGQQDPSWRYFPSDSEKVAVQDHVYVGADRICAACKSLSSAEAEFCGNCGAPLSGAKQAQTGAQREKGDNDAFEAEDLKKRQLADKVPATAVANQQTKANPRSKITCALILIVALVLGGGAIFAFTRTTNAKAYVTGYRWERSIGVEALSPVSSKSSCNSMPVDAYAVDQRTEQVDTRQVADGETCSVKQVDQGDGTFREERQCQTKYRDEPVYGEVCYYTVNRWTHSRDLDTQGDKTSAPTWSDIALNTGSCLGCERESGRTETYYLVLKGDGDKTFECPVPVDQWNSTNIESSFTVEIGSILKDVKCETLKPAS